MIKRFLVFYGETYYPSGGFEDPHFFVHDLADAETQLARTEGDWAHAVDTTTWQIVKRWESDDWKNGPWKAKP